MVKQGLMATAIALGTLGALGTAPASAAVSVQLQIAPPAPRVEYVPAPRRGQVWAPGYWDWRGQRHVWIAGHWVKERPGYRYDAPRWVQNGRYWQQQRGGWQRVDHRRGDRDGDGVPNRFDQRPNNPYLR